MMFLSMKGLPVIAVEKNVRNKLNIKPTIQKCNIFSGETFGAF